MTISRRRTSLRRLFPLLGIIGRTEGQRNIVADNRRILSSNHIVASHDDRIADLNAAA